MRAYYWLGWVCFFVLGSHLAVAQETAIVSTIYGKAWLADGDSLEGQMNLDFSQDLLEVAMPNRMLKVLSPRQVQVAIFTDEHGNASQTFYVLPYAMRKQYQVPVFFQMALQGQKASLLTRNKLITETVPTFDSFVGRTMYYTRTRLIKEMYLRLPDGNITYWEGKSENDLYKILPDHQQDLEVFIKNNRLKLADFEDMMRLIVYYNRLK
ncbi:hypothetical protein SAMN05421780_10851 [Flexibacter flexilis DSM 6793]|uniref:Uncharacterized protein n=1 Tax=Flexibacter flexilis DSM 6793 TaxID=927664 RepID=A0A1I1L3Z6_9BACT|nr:hypothetical protein [Flexibacter flexilis]SFC67786.1 hypothetical protein SAMN05421780_10851 [Flexibacter flexilis DSM 6793]